MVEKFDGNQRLAQARGQVDDTVAYIQNEKK